jgi:hypothetical protein
MGGVRAPIKMSTWPRWAKTQAAQGVRRKAYQLAGYADDESLDSAAGLARDES